MWGPVAPHIRVASGTYAYGSSARHAIRGVPRSVTLFRGHAPRRLTGHMHKGNIKRVKRITPARKKELKFRKLHPTIQVCGKVY